MIEKNQILVPNYKIGIELAYYLKNSKKSIFVSNKRLDYEVNKKINYLTEEEPNIDKLDLEIIPQTNKEIKTINNIKEIRDIAKTYKYIALENDLQSIFIDNFGYIECEPYSESKEGKRWIQIYNLKTEKVELERLKSLDILQTQKEYQNEFFSYIETKYDQMSPIELYKLFFKENPIFYPNKLDENFYEALYINVIEKEQMILDKALIKYINEDFLYIGKEAFDGAKNQIIYNPKFEKYTEFEPSTIYLSIKENDYYDRKQIKQKSFAKIYAKQKGLFSNEPNFYSNYKKYLKNILYKIYISKENINYEEQFKIDSEFYKLFLKTEKIIANFNAFLIEKEPKNIKKDAFFNQIRWDFYSLESQIIIDIVTSKSNIQESYFKRKYALADYWIITEEQILKIDHEEELQTKTTPTTYLEEDLFYWEKPTFQTREI